MTWTDPRPPTRPGDPVRSSIGPDGSDEAKHRLDDASPRASRSAPAGPGVASRLPGWVVPVLAALAVLVVVIGTAVALGRDGEPAGQVASGPSPSPTPASDPPSGAASEPAGTPDLSGTYRGTATIDSVSATGEQQPTRTENVRGRVTCDAEECRIEVEYLTDRFRRPITVPAAGGTDSFSRPAQGGDPCDRVPGVSVESRAEGRVTLGPSGLEWRLVNHADEYSDCPGGVFVGGSTSVGTATRG